ncbi:MAG: outer rane efflux protein [Edaphobacter sp.]|nr:outer rane efflux protein [Edaphobacter sp.]
MTRLHLIVTSSVLALAVTPAIAQISFTTAVDLALKNSPKVRVAEADVAKARAVLEQTKDVYIPAFSIGSGLGYTYGFPFGAPSLFNITAQSLLFDESQRNYIRAARTGLEAANHSLSDVRQQIMQDAATTYLSLDADLERIKAAGEESRFAGELTRIIQQRLEAGQDTQVELTRSKITSANLQLRQIQLEDDVSDQRLHLAHLTGLSADDITTDHASIPLLPPLNRSPASNTQLPESIQAAYSVAQSKLQSAFGDSRKLYRPQIGLGVQYSRLASFNNYQQYYLTFDNYNSVQIGLQFNLPIFDATKRAKARESLAEANRSVHEADQARNQFFEGRQKISTAIRELQARAEVDSLERELAQNQVDVVRIQLRDGNPGGQPVSPKEEQNARIQERARYLDFLDTDLQLRQTQINLLRSNGQLEDWLKSTTLSQPSAASKSE